MYFRPFYLALFLLVTTKAHAEISIYKMGERFLSFEVISEENILINESCKKKCLAYKSLSALSFKSIQSSDLEGGKNPGAVLCKKILSSQVLYLKDLNGNENSFCLFSDQSIISNGSLYGRAALNDKK